MNIYTDIMNICLDSDVAVKALFSVTTQDIYPMSVNEAFWLVESSRAVMSNISLTENTHAILSITRCLFCDVTTTIFINGYYFVNVCVYVTNVASNNKLFEM